MGILSHPPSSSPAPTVHPLVHLYVFKLHFSSDVMLAHTSRFLRCFTWEGTRWCGLLRGLCGLCCADLCKFKLNLSFGHLKNLCQFALFLGTLSHRDDHRDPRLMFLICAPSRKSRFQQLYTHTYTHTHCPLQAKNPGRSSHSSRALMRQRQTLIASAFTRLLSWLI